VVFYFSLIASLISGCTMLFGTIHPASAIGLLILIGLGGSATLAQLAMTRAYRTGRHWWLAACPTARWYSPACLACFCGTRHCR
jgi:hypothetical protein